MLDGFLSLKKKSLSMNLSLPPLPYFGLGDTEETAKPKCVLAIGKMLFLVYFVPLAISHLKTMTHTSDLSWDCLK